MYIISLNALYLKLEMCTREKKNPKISGKYKKIHYTGYKHIICIHNHLLG